MDQYIGNTVELEAKKKKKSAFQNQRILCLTILDFVDTFGAITLHLGPHPKNIL